jgi:hypothetical protein
MGNVPASCQAFKWLGIYKVEEMQNPQKILLWKNSTGQGKISRGSRVLQEDP